MLRQTVTVIAVMSAVFADCRTEAHAQPPAFPDLSRYTPVNVADYSMRLANNGRLTPIFEVFFLAPQGFSCAVRSRGIYCDGDIPGTHSGQYGTNAATDAGIRPAAPSVKNDNGTVLGQPIKPLPPLHSITVDGSTCGVDDAGMTACKDAQGRGFVLSPNGSAWLPNV